MEPQYPSYAAGAPQLGMLGHPQLLYVIRKLEAGVPRGNQEKEAKSKGLMGSLLSKAVTGMSMYPWATVTSQGLFQSMVKGLSVLHILPSLHGNLALPFFPLPFPVLNHTVTICMPAGPLGPGRRKRWEHPHRLGASGKVLPGVCEGGGPGLQCRRLQVWGIILTGSTPTCQPQKKLGMLPIFLREVQYPFVRKFVFLGWTDSTINSFGTCPPFSIPPLQWHVAHNFPGGEGGGMRCYLSRDRFSGFWGCVLIPDKGWRASEGIKKELNREGRSRL